MLPKNPVIHHKTAQLKESDGGFAVILVFVLLTNILFPLRQLIAQDELVEEVINPSLPRQGTLQVDFSPDVIVDAVQFMRCVPTLICLDRQGRIYAANESKGRITLFRPDGYFQTFLGSRGSGEDEYRFIKSISCSGNGDLLVLDSNASRTLIVSVREQDTRSIPWDLPIQKYQDRILAATDSGYVALVRESNMGESRPLYCSLVFFDWQGKRRWVVPNLSDGYLLNLPQGGGRSRLLRLNRPKTMICSDLERGLLYLIGGERYHIKAYDFGGRLVGSFSRPYERVRIGEAEMQEVESLPNLPEDWDLRSVADYALVDDANRLWVRTAETKKEGGKSLTAYDIFSPDGTYQARVWLTLHPLLFFKDMVYSLDSEGRIIRWRITWQAGKRK